MPSPSLLKTWEDLAPLESAYELIRQGALSPTRRRQWMQSTPPSNSSAPRSTLFTGLHDCLKQIDKAVRRHEKALADKAKEAGKRQTADRATKQLKAALEDLHAEVKNAESAFAHIHWLQERFPEAKYEDVTGLCKLADLDEIKEQDYSLNPGRYVGVVIEEDGKTEEEFIDDLVRMTDDLTSLSQDSKVLEDAILERSEIGKQLMKAALPDGWAVEKSSEFCLRVADGTHDTPKPTQEGHPLITSKNLKGGQILLDGAYNISTADFYAVNKRKQCRPMGRLVFDDRNCWANGTCPR